MADQPSVALDKTKMSVSIVIVIVAVVALEKLFHFLHFLTKETAFKNMIVRIEKELMIVGSTAFVFRLIVTPSELAISEWGLALDYADLIIPIFSFCFCAIGVILIVSSLRQCDLWSKSYHHHLVELLDELFEKSSGFCFQWSWKPMNEIITKMEFRVFHALFCDFFLLQPKAFAFDEYVARVYEKYVFSIISIGTFHWMILALIVLLNWMRIVLNIQYQTCAMGDIECEEMNDVIVFTCAGALLVTATGVLVNISRSLELKIMAKRDITSYKSYPSFLQNFEGAYSDQIIIEKLDEKAFRELVKSNRNKALTERLENQNFLGKINISKFQKRSQLNFISAVLWLFHWYAEARLYASRVLLNVQNMFFKPSEGVKLRWGSWDESDPDENERVRPSQIETQKFPFILSSFLRGGSKIHSRSGQYAQTDEGVQLALNSPQLENLPTSDRLPSDHSVSGVGVSGSGSGEKTNRPVPPVLEISPMQRKRRSLIRLATMKNRRFSIQAKVLEVKGEYIKDLFWFSNPELYFETVRFFIMLVALYLALWLVDYASAAIGAVWKVISILPGIFSAINYLYIVKTAALLKAMYSIDFDAAEKVLQQTDAARDLERKIREVLLAKLEITATFSGDLKSRVYEMFCEIDYDNGGFISRHEFSIYLSRLGVHMNRKQWKETFRNIDRDTSETIDFHEFFALLYPDHQEVNKFERKRLQTISQRVGKIQQEYNTDLSTLDNESETKKAYNSSKSPSSKAAFDNSIQLVSSAISNRKQKETIVEERENSDDEKSDLSPSVNFHLGARRSSESSSSSCGSNYDAEIGKISPEIKNQIGADSGDIVV